MEFENNINDACIAALANATLTWSAGSAMGLFEAAYIDPLGMAGSRPMIECKTSQVGLLTYDTAVTVQKTGSATTTSYTVAEAQPDGRGMTRLFLK